MRLVVFGAGTLGGRVAARWPGRAIGVTATETRHAALRADGVEPTTTWPSLTTEDVVLIALSGSDSQRRAALRLADQPMPTRAVFVSSTAWHRPYTGEIRVDDPPGDGDRARAAAAAEAAFRSWCPHGSVVRCGGLYTQDRGAAAAFRRKRSAPVGPPDAPLPLIHYDEAADLCLTLLTQPAAPRTVFGITSQPTREAFYSALAAELGCEPPAFGEPRGGSRFRVD